MHLFPTVLLLVDTFLFSPPWTVGIVPALIASATVTTFYWFWLEHCLSHNGSYPYPLLDQLVTEERVLLYIGCALTMAATTMILKWAFGKFSGRLGGGVLGGVKRDQGWNIEVY